MLQLDISNLEYRDLLEFANTGIMDFWEFEFTLVFQSEYHQSKMIRDLVLYLFEKNNINVPWKGRFALLSDELVNNSIEYGSLPEDKNKFLVSFKTLDNFLAINIEVSDTGRGIEAKTSSQMAELRILKETSGFKNYLAKRGRGLFQMITNLVDELYFRDDPNGGLVVGITKKLEILPIDGLPA